MAVAGDAALSACGGTAMADLDPAQLAARKGVADAIARALQIVRRSAWGAQAPKHSLEPDWFYDSIVVHYTGHDTYESPRAIQDFDVNHQHWDDIAYHYAVSPTGKIYEGREIVFKGSHVKLQNTGKIGIVCMGDFDSAMSNLLLGKSNSGDPVRSSMLDALRRLRRELMLRFPITTFGGHKEYGVSESCPGSNLLPHVEAMRTELRLSAPVFQKF